MQVDAAKKLFTVDDYYRMAAAGIIGPDERVELIDGEIYEMSPIGSRHLGGVNRATVHSPGVRWSVFNILFSSAITRNPNRMWFS
jgi:hypothetical protein